MILNLEEKRTGAFKVQSLIWRANDGVLFETMGQGRYLLTYCLVVQLFIVRCIVFHGDDVDEGRGTREEQGICVA